MSARTPRLSRALPLLTALALWSCTTNNPDLRDNDGDGDGDLADAFTGELPGEDSGVGGEGGAMGGAGGQVDTDASFIDEDASVGGAGGEPMGGFGGQPMGGEPMGGQPMGGEPMGGEPGEDGGLPDAALPDEGLPDAMLPDEDGDGVPDDEDNCPSVFNPNQSNIDGDEFGDVCDPCNASPERCDGDDNDCDGLADEDFDGLGLPCSDGVGACAAEGTVICAVGGQSATCDAEAGEPVDEQCDNLDNDCDGQIDEGIEGCCMPGAMRRCGEDVGRCRSGFQTCSADQVWSPCDGIGPEVEICDGSDNDCDGRLDEGTLNACNQCGPLPVEICNRVDDDCDGSIDEEFPDLDLPCDAGLGQCQRRGRVICVNDQETACGVQPDDPVDEVCDGLDNDCDGLLDEDFEIGERCQSGVGACTRDGVWQCDPLSGRACSAIPGQPQDEACNGIDDNCDGQIDERFEDLGEACTVGQGVCLGEGVRECSANGAGTRCVAETGSPQPESCNDLDDDCDGRTDEDYRGLGRECEVREGQCASVGVLVCSEVTGESFCDAEPPVPADEICNNIDDDCDGGIDEALNCIDCVPESCNGEDDDCDGQVDEDLPEVCIVPIATTGNGEQGTGLGENLIAYDDLNGDGVPDAIAAAPRRSQEVDAIFAVSGADGSFIWRRALNGSAGTSLAIGDFGGNGRRLAVGAPQAWNGVFSPRGRIYFLSAENQLLLSLESEGGERIGKQMVAGQFGGLNTDDLAIGDDEANDDGGRLFTFEFNPSPQVNPLGTLDFGEEARLGERVFKGLPAGPLPNAGALDDLMVTSRFADDRILLVFNSGTLGEAGPTGGLAAPEPTNATFAEDVAYGRWSPGAAGSLAVGAPGTPVLNNDGLQEEAGVVFFYNLAGEAIGRYSAELDGGAQGWRLAALPRPEATADALLVGAEGAGRVDVVNRATGMVQTLDAESAGFGKALIITEPGVDGTRRLFVGAPDHSGSRGRVHVYSIR